MVTAKVDKHKQIEIITLTEPGHALALRLAAALEKTKEKTHLEYTYNSPVNGMSVCIAHKPKPFTEYVQQAFTQKHPLILICATGIAVRTLAPVLMNKHEDPPVLVLDEKGEFVIPLLSGHEGGANAWAAQIAKLLDGQLVITTAKPYVKPMYTVGMGCERHCPEAALMTLLESCLAMKGIGLDQIESINSIDIKADEVGLISLAKTLNIPYQTFDVPTLTTVESLLSVKSEYVYKTVGVYGVAESAALIAAQTITGSEIDKNSAELFLTKQKSTQATCAIARSYL